MLGRKGGLLVALEGVRVTRDGRVALEIPSLRLERGGSLVVMGPNGSGKSTLVAVCAGMLRPSEGEVELLGVPLRGSDVRSLRSRIGVVSSALADALARGSTVLQAVVTGKHAALAHYWHTYSEADHERAVGFLGRFGLADRVGSGLMELSQGERQKVLICRSLMSDPELLILDEPMAGLDLGSREDLLVSLDLLMSDDQGPAGLILVTHHVEEIPTSVHDALLLRDGRVITSGPIRSSITSETLSVCFDRPIEVISMDGRLYARGVRRRA